MPEKRILLVSYHFGPGCPTGGFRWNAIAPYLCQAGWNVDAITLARANLERGTDAQVHTDAQANTGPGRLETFPVENPRWPESAKTALLSAVRFVRERIIRRPEAGSGPPQAVDPKSLFVWTPGFRRSLRARVLHGLDHLARESAEMLWSIRATRVAAGLARTRSYCAVVVCSPPQITQTVGARISRDFGIPYVADYRDAWILGLGSHAYYYPDLERLIGKRFEKRTLRRARVVIHNTDRARLAVANEFDFEAEHYAIPNGYDGTKEVGDPDPRCFRIVYTGHLHPFMDVRPVLSACARLRDQHSLGPDTLRIEFVGTAPVFAGVQLSALADAYGLGGFFSRLDPVGRAEAEQFQQAASVLVAFDSIYTVVVPSKFYEYVRMKGTMLLIGNRDGAFSDAASMLGLRVFDPTQQAEIDASLEAAFVRWRAGGFDTPMDPNGIFDRRHQSQKIAEILGRLSQEATP
jgi:glycosyltransferase involved in cell wall biosynthesis